MALGTIGTNQIASEAVTVPKVTDQVLSSRNFIINGDMQCWQRATAATAANNSYSTVDRWAFGEGTDGAYTSERSTDTPTGTGFSIKAQVTTADTSLAAGQYAYIWQSIEAQNLQSLLYGTASAKTLTLSFWVKSSKTGTYSIVIRKNDSTLYAFTHDYSISSANTWEKKTITITPTAGSTSFITASAGAIANDNGLGFEVIFALGQGSTYAIGTSNTWSSNSNTYASSNQVNWMDSTSNNFYLSQVQLEIGDAATPFEHENYGTTLAKCQRYFHRFQSDTAYDAYAPAYWLVTTQVYSMYEFPVTMRSQPSIAVSAVSDWKIHSNGGDGNLGSLIVNRATPNNMQTFSDQSSNTGTAGHAGAIRNYGSTSPYIEFSAELQMKIENAKYHALDGDNTNPNASITCVIDGKLTSVPISEGNADYIEIMRQVSAGTLTIEDAD